MVFLLLLSSAFAPDQELELLRHSVAAGEIHLVREPEHEEEDPGENPEKPGRHPAIHIRVEVLPGDHVNARPRFVAFLYRVRVHVFPVINDAVPQAAPLESRREEAAVERVVVARADLELLWNNVVCFVGPIFLEFW